MPPMPSFLDSETTALISILRRRQHDLTDFQIPRLRECKGPLAVQQRLAAELRDDVDVFARQAENLDSAVDDQRSERGRRELRQVADEFLAALASVKKDMRAALLESKRAIDASQLSGRDELLRSSAVREKQDLNEKVTEDALMKANNDVTEALQRTITLMQGELERSVLSSQLLDTSSAALRSTSTTHDVLDGLMATSKHLITALEKSDWLDRLLILSGLAFFVLVVAFILKQRIVDRGLRIAFWWTRFIPDFSGDEAALAQMEAGLSVSDAFLKTAVAGTLSTAAASMAGTGPSVPAPTPDGSLSDVLSMHSPEPIDVAAISSESVSPSRTAESTSSTGAGTRMHDEM